MTACAGMRLTAAAQEARDEFESEFGDRGNCSCHLSPPCNSCLHPGNPNNQAEDDAAWEVDPDFTQPITAEERERVLGLISAAMDEPNPEGFTEKAKAAVDASPEALKLFGFDALMHAALFCDDLAVDHPRLDAACIRRVAAAQLIRCALLIIHGARRMEGTAFNPARVALVVFNMAEEFIKQVKPDAPEAEIIERKTPGEFRAWCESEGICPPRKTKEQQS